MEKLLLGAYLSALAGFFAAVLSIVKLVNEKENKTSEFRQDWTNSVRESFSDLVAKVINMASHAEYQKRLGEIEIALNKQSPINEKRLEMIHKAYIRVGEDITATRHDLYQSYARCTLHFKPNEPLFKPIEVIFNQCSDNNKKIAKSSNKEERVGLKDENIKLAQEIIEKSREILKEEWERVKRGEPIYAETKKYSLRGGVFMLVVLLLIGGYATFLSFKSGLAGESTGTGVDSIRSIKVQPAVCWQVQEIRKTILKINACTGEVINISKELSPILR